MPQQQQKKIAVVLNELMNFDNEKYKQFHFQLFVCILLVSIFNLYLMFMLLGYFFFLLVLHVICYQITIDWFIVCPRSPTCFVKDVYINQAQMAVRRWIKTSRHCLSYFSKYYTLQFNELNTGGKSFPNQKLTCGVLQVSEKRDPSKY